MGFRGLAGGACGLALLLTGGANAATDFQWRGLTAHVPTAHTSAAAVAWCGSGETSVNRPDSADVALSSANVVHVSYVVPSDGVDRFATYAPAIVSDLAAADAWWRAQDATRTPRFDLADFPCSTRLGPRLRLEPRPHVAVRNPRRAARKQGARRRSRRLLRSLGLVVRRPGLAVARPPAPVPTRRRGLRERQGQDPDRGRGREHRVH